MHALRANVQICLQFQRGQGTQELPELKALSLDSDTESLCFLSPGVTRPCPGAFQLAVVVWRAALPPVRAEPEPASYDAPLGACFRMPVTGGIPGEKLPWRFSLDGEEQPNLRLGG